MQKDIGSVMGLYPTPTTVCGTVLEDGRVNWLTIAHVGVVNHGNFLVSIDKNHKLSEAAIRTNGTVSVSLVSRAMMEPADWCGIAKSAKTDKSGAFKYHFDDVDKAPVLEEAPVCMTCRVIDQVDVGEFSNFILEPVHTYVQEECLNDKGKIDYVKVDPLLFEFQSAKYLYVGGEAGNAWKEGTDFVPKAD
ncbi:MAG: flavin reductase family protein [Coriobacteriales bacterium]|jgi:flavin reductase (DIM6/NTAB) family NADH-FMN oxidoreductase RutF